MDSLELKNRFDYHPPQTPMKVTAHQNVRADCLWVADRWNSTLPESREKSLAMTKLEEAMFWANAAIARNGPALGPIVENA